MIQEKSPRRTRKKRSRDLHPDAERVLEGKLYRVEEVAQILQVGQTEVRKLINNGELIAARIAGSYRITETAIRAYVEARNQEAAEAAAEKRHEQQRHRELERRQQRDPAVRWAYAQCIWCGVESALCTRNDRLAGEIRCEACAQISEHARQRGERLARTRDVVERSVAIEVRERDELAEEELGTFDREDRDSRIAHRVSLAQKGPIVNFGPDVTARIRASMIERAQQRPAHYLTFRCALCGKPQAVSRRILFDHSWRPSCSHDEPYFPASKYLAETSLIRARTVDEIEQEEIFGAPHFDVRLELMYHTDNDLAIAQLVARELNIEAGTHPDPDLDEGEWAVCRCAYCGRDLAVARTEYRLGTRQGIDVTESR
jgi:excisionase family DNA binding protein